MLDVLVQLDEPSVALLHEDEERYFLISAVRKNEVNDDDEFDYDKTVAFENWKALVTFCTDVAIATHEVIREALRDALASVSTGADDFSDLVNFRYWTVSVGRQRSTVHESAWRARVAKYCPNSARVGIRHERVAYAGWELVDEGGKLFITTEEEKTNPLLTPTGLVVLLLFVLSDLRTGSASRSQYSPFLEKPLRSLIEKERTHTHPPKLPVVLEEDLEAWAQHVRQGFEEILQRHGV